MTSDNSIDLNRLTPQSCNKWKSYESTKRKQKPMKCYRDSERCRRLNLVKLFNYVLISCSLLVCLINANDSSLGCSSNPCIFGVCIDDLNRWVDWLKGSSQVKTQSNWFHRCKEKSICRNQDLWTLRYFSFFLLWKAEASNRDKSMEFFVVHWIIAPFLTSIYRLIRFKNNFIFLLFPLTVHLSILFQFVFLLLYRRLYWPAMSNKLGWVLVGAVLERWNVHWWRRIL